MTLPRVASEMALPSAFFPLLRFGLSAATLDGTEKLDGGYMDNLTPNYHLRTGITLGKITLGNRQRQLPHQVSVLHSPVLLKLRNQVIGPGILLDGRLWRVRRKRIKPMFVLYHPAEVCIGHFRIWLGCHRAVVLPHRTAPDMLVIFLSGSKPNRGAAARIASAI